MRKRSALLRKLRYVKNECWKMQVFILVMNAIIVFLGFAIPLRFFSQSVFLAFIPTLVYVGYRVFVEGVETESCLVNRIAINNPSLKEQLKTAYDNRKHKGRNIVLTSLNYDVSKRMDKTGFSSLLDSEQLVMKTITIVVLAFILLTINFLGFDLINLKTNFPNLDRLMDDFSDETGFDISKGIGDFGSLQDYVADDRYSDKEERPDIGSSSGGIVPGFNEGEIPDAGSGAGSSADEDIFGDPSSAKIEGRKVDMKLPPEYGGNIEIKDVNEGTGSIEIPEKDIVGEASQVPEQEPVGYRELVKKYFESIQREV